MKSRSPLPVPTMQVLYFTSVVLLLFASALAAPIPFQVEDAVHNSIKIAL